MRDQKKVSGRTGGAPDPWDENRGGRCDDAGESGEGRRRRYFCDGGHCPGYPFKASCLPRPPSCVTGKGGANA
jgi:hypothetical protein